MALRPRSPYSEDLERVQREQARIQREMAEAERAAKRKHKAAKPKPVGGYKIRTTTSAITLPRPKEHRFVRSGDTPRERAPRRPARHGPREVNAARVKFMLLCLFVVLLFFFLWRNAPMP